MKSSTLMILAAVGALAATAPAGPFAPPAGQPGSTAVTNTDPAIAAWATGYAGYQPGPNVDPIWRTPAQALGAAEGSPFTIVSLGDGGTITLTFARPILNRTGWDFAVFENSFNEAFLELAYVEVSSDGLTFARFPSASLTPGPVTFEGGSVDATNVDRLAGKYAAGYGTPFDLAALAGTAGLDLNRVTHVRLVDVVGDGFSLDGEGRAIYDPYPTVGSGGFDLDGLAVLHERRTLAGDANEDGVVDLADLATLASHWNGPGAWDDGDFSGDGAVSLEDLAALAANWNAGGGDLPVSLAAAGLPAVPEPASLALAAVALAALPRRRR